MTYACVMWSTTKGDEEKLRRLERKFLRRQHGRIFITETKQWD